MIEAEENVDVAEIAKQLEAEGFAAEEQAPELQKSQTIAGKLADLETEETIRAGNSPEFRGVRDWIPQVDIPGPLPLADLHERIAILCAAGVTHYRDADVELRFDPDAPKKAMQPTVVRTERF